MSDPVKDAALKELQRTLMEGSQVSQHINFAELHFRQISMINIFAGLHDERFISAVDSLEDSVADMIDKDYEKAVLAIENAALEISNKKIRHERDITKKDFMISRLNWNMARLKYRQLQKLLGRIGYKPPQDVVQEDIIDIDDKDEEVSDDDDDSDGDEEPDAVAGAK